MQEKILVIILILLFINIGFIGCTEKQKNSIDDETIIDSDGDGYPDDEDDFPKNEKFYEKAPININNSIRFYTLFVILPNEKTIL